MNEQDKPSSLQATGIPEGTDLKGSMPTPERFRRGPVALIECFQEIPCDPCADACPEGAIRPFTDICSLPAIDYDKCTGCALCVVKCPGLAIFVIDLSRDDGTADVRIPYEYRPLPARGDQVAAVDRHGREVATAEVVRSQLPKGFDRTALVTLRVPAQFALDVRGLRVLSQKGGDAA